MTKEQLVKHITITAAAKRLRVSRSYLSTVLNGHRSSRRLTKRLEALIRVATETTNQTEMNGNGKPGVS